jgi:hypothetical protein
MRFSGSNIVSSTRASCRIMLGTKKNLSAFVELDQSLVGPGTQAQQQQAQPGPSSAAPGKKKNYALNSSDKLFAQLCDLNFAVVGGLLNRIAKRINENYEVHIS